MNSAAIKVGGFASDVGVGHPNKPAEPWDPSDPLSSHARALFTPHVGGYADNSYEHMAVTAAATIRQIQKGEAPQHWANGARTE